MVFRRRKPRPKPLIEQRLGRVGQQVQQFERVSRPQQLFSQEQEALHSQFGGGEHFWGLGEESSTNVQINNDLHPSWNGDYGTADCFFGGNPRNKLGDNGETSSLFF